MTDFDLNKTLGKTLVNGLVSGLGLSIMAGETQSFVIGNSSYPVWQVGAAIGAVSSFSTELISNIILPHIEGNQKWVHLESMALHLGTSAGVTIALGKVLNGNLNMNEARIFGLAGATGEMISSYIYNNVIDVPLF